MGRTGDAWSIASAAAECRRLGRLLKTALFRTGHEIRKRGKHENEFWVLLALRFEAASWLCCRLYLQGLGISARPSSSFAPSNGSAAKGLIWRADHAGQGTQFAAPPNSGEFSYRNQKLYCSERVTKSGRRKARKRVLGTFCTPIRSGKFALLQALSPNSCDIPETIVVVRSVERQRRQGARKTAGGCWPGNAVGRSSKLWRVQLRLSKNGAVFVLSLLPDFVTRLEQAHLASGPLWPGNAVRRSSKLWRVQLRRWS